MDALALVPQTAAAAGQLVSGNTGGAVSTLAHSFNNPLTQSLAQQVGFHVAKNLAKAAKNQVVRAMNKPRKNRNRSGSRAVTKSKARPKGPPVTLYSSPRATGAPAFRAMADGSIVIRHEEMVGGAFGSANFNLERRYAVNPGLATLFPWLSSQAAGYEKYCIRKLELVYRGVVGTGTDGTIFLSSNPDASAADPVTENDVTNLKGVKFCRPWETRSMSAVLSRTTKDKMLFVRTGSLPANQDVKTFDAGALHVSTDDFSVAAGTKVGKLWVRYEIMLCFPTTAPPALSYYRTVGTLPAAIFVSGAAADVVQGNTWHYATPAAQDTINPVSTNKIRFDVAGTYRVNMMALWDGVNPITACNIVVDVPGTATVTGWVTQAADDSLWSEHATVTVLQNDCVCTANIGSAGGITFIMEIVKNPRIAMTVS